MNSKESIDPYEWEMGEYYVRSYSSPKGYIIAMKNLWLMLKDLREGKYTEYVRRQEGNSFVVNPDALVPILKELKRETELAKLWLICKGAQEMIRQMQSTQSALIELAWNLFINANPQPEDWNLLYTLMPSFKNRALCYQARLVDPSLFSLY